MECGAVKRLSHAMLPGTILMAPPFVLAYPLTALPPAQNESQAPLKFRVALLPSSLTFDMSEGRVKFHFVFNLRKSFPTLSS